MLYSPKKGLGFINRAVFCLQAVDELLAVLGASGDEQVPVPSWHYRTANADGADETMRLRDALIQCYDIRCNASFHLHADAGDLA
jgi:hypothetical protein